MKCQLVTGPFFLILVFFHPGFFVVLHGHAAAAEEIVAKEIATLCPCRCCPDDYCPKKSPCFRLPPTCGCCDDYCPKKRPCFCLPVLFGCCDNYCPKKCPDIDWPCRYPSYYKCGPLAACRTTKPKCKPTMSVED